MEALLVLPKPSDGFSPNILIYLNEHFKTHQDLHKSSSISTELKKDCGDLDRKLTFLQKTLSLLTTQWLYRLSSIKTIFHQLNHKFHHFTLNPTSDVIAKVGSELSVLTKELNRIQVIQEYVETTLRLEVLVGDLEDAVLCVVNHKKSNLADFNWKHEKLLLGVRVMNEIDTILGFISKKWKNILKSVDSRVDRSLGSLRLKALADYRVLLNSIGWPPSLLSSGSEVGNSSELQNPLFIMQGDTKEKFSQSFLGLCHLQLLHTQREERKILTKDKNDKLALWSIDELVSPIALITERHFSKWFDQPKFIFALVYKITRDFAVGVDEILQPLVDKARFVGCSAKEDWVWAMTKMLSVYLKEKIFSVLADRYGEKNNKAQITYSWLHLVDHVIAFDKRMRTLADFRSSHLVGESLGFSREISLMSIFCDQFDWLKIWAKIELRDSLKKLNSELESPNAWAIDKVESGIEFGPEPFFLSSRVDHKAPPIAETVVKITQTMIERCQTLPNILLRAQFIRTSSVRFLWHFFNILLQRCTETVYTVSYEEGDTLVKICGSVNAARYCESILREWSEDVNFTEMRMAEDNSNTQLKCDPDDYCCFFWEEVKFLMKLETDWIIEIMSDVLRQFDTLSQEYVRNKEQWGWKLEGSSANLLMETVSDASSDFVEALDALRNQLSVLHTYLNSKDFLYLWRSIADGIDQFIFSSIIMSGATFSNQGIHQFSTDMQALFFVFSPLCVRPESFFPYIKDSLKLLKMDSKDAKHLLSISAKDGKRMEMLQLAGISNVSPSQADKILRNRKFGL